MKHTQTIPAGFEHYYQKLEKIRSVLRKIASDEGTPLYIFDKEEVQRNYRAFVNSFRDKGLTLKPFYATKSNHYMGVLKTVVEEGGNIDVSSQRELKFALEAGAREIVYTGPAKTKEDFDLILEHSSKITVNLETLRELRLLSEMAVKNNKTVRCGVRIYTVSQSGWTKFGIPITQLRNFFDEAKKLKGIDFCGIHFHISYNFTPERYVATIKEVGEYLKANLTDEEIGRIKYLDIGGGIMPDAFEGYYSWNPKQLMWYPDENTFFSDIQADRFQPRYLFFEVDPLEIFASAISMAIRENIHSLNPAIEIYAEPGKFISHSCMHLLTSIVDVKENKFAIADGGMNMVGYERYQYLYYTPTYNLNQFDLTREIPFLVYGSLCTPEDIWTYYVYSKGTPKEGDVFLLPFQGAYTYTWAQDFIKGIPKVYDL